MGLAALGIGSAFSQAGRKLADLHLNYETVEPFPLKVDIAGKLTEADYRVEKMKYGKKGMAFYIRPTTANAMLII